MRTLDGSSAVVSQMRSGNRLTACFIIWLLVLSSQGCIAGGPGTKPMDNALRNRVNQSLDHLIVTKNAAHERAWWQRVPILKSATAESLLRPTLVPSIYIFSEETGEPFVVLWWISSEMTLRDVTITNPVNGRSHSVQFNEDELHKRHAHVMDGVIYREIINLPEDFLNAEDSPMLIATTGDGVSWAVVYPSKEK